MLLHQLEIFKQVAEKNSFSKAAQALFLSQSTVSTHISNLEKYFGSKLFDRLGKEIVLTPFGEKLYPWAIEILNLKDRALWEMKDGAPTIEGHLRFAASSVPAHYLLPRLLSQFLGKYNGIRFAVVQSGSESVAEKLINGDAEIGMLGKQYEEDQLVYLPYIEEKLVLISASDLLLPPRISLTELKNHPFIFRESDSGTQANLVRMLALYGINLSHLKTIGYFNNLEALKEGVKEGIGISIISEIAAADYVRSKKLNASEVVELPEKRILYFAYHKKRTLSPWAQAFIEFSMTKRSLITEML
ncbi:LysR family transcriptional regulator [Dehalobacter sp. DCM]|uniref:selenium metabolism-associated LysR family transcriptional regulator n=1 Tax=Dehalobacter sp. DCM TaxID=2907827 RepID=UPI0030812411|nr:LysR family transcriptional regulator [Dehalobacter sp. DCM]